VKVARVTLSLLAGIDLFFPSPIKRGIISIHQVLRVLLMRYSGGTGRQQGLRKITSCSYPVTAVTEMKKLLLLL